MIHSHSLFLPRSYKASLYIEYLRQETPIYIVDIWTETNPCFATLYCLCRTEGASAQQCLVAVSGRSWGLVLAGQPWAPPGPHSWELWGLREAPAPGSGEMKAIGTWPLMGLGNSGAMITPSLNPPVVWALACGCYPAGNTLGLDTPERSCEAKENEWPPQNRFAAPTDMPAPVDIWLLFRWWLLVFPRHAMDRLGDEHWDSGIPSRLHLSSTISVSRTVFCTSLHPGSSSLHLPRGQTLSLKGSLTLQKGF